MIHTTTCLFQYYYKIQVLLFMNWMEDGIKYFIIISKFQISFNAFRFRCSQFEIILGCVLEFMATPVYPRYTSNGNSLIVVAHIPQRTVQNQVHQILVHTFFESYY